MKTSAILWFADFFNFFYLNSWIGNFVTVLDDLASNFDSIFGVRSSDMATKHRLVQAYTP